MFIHVAVWYVSLSSRLCGIVAAQIGFPGLLSLTPLNWKKLEKIFRLDSFDNNFETEKVFLPIYIVSFNLSFVLLLKPLSIKWLINCENELGLKKIHISLS